MSIRSAIAQFVLFLTAILPVFAAGNGLKGEYFPNTGIVGSPVAVRTDAVIDFSWRGSPIAGTASNDFSVRWTGKLEAPVTGAVQLGAYTNEGVRVWLGGTLVIDRWASHAAQMDVSGPVNVVAGQMYDLKIEFYDTGGSSAAKLYWSYPGQTSVLIPTARLYSDGVTAMVAPVYLSDLKPTFSENGWGPYEQDRSNGEAKQRDGDTQSIKGVLFAKGLGVHARSELRYALAGKYKAFYSELGIDDETNGGGSVVYEVWLDGVRKYASDLIPGGQAAKSIALDVTGGNELKLIVLDSGDGNSLDHADWAGARVVNQALTGAPPPPPPPVTAPVTPTGLAATPGNAQVSVMWNASTGAANYALYRSTALGTQGSAVYTGALTSFLDSGVVNGTTYYYSVAASNTGGSSAVSAQVSAKPVAPPVPGAPGTLSAAPGNAQVTLNWGAASGAASYNVYRSTTSGGQGDTPIASGISLLTFTDTALTNGTTYFYKVAGVNGNGVGAKSNEANAKPVAPVPAAPTALTAAPGNTEVTLNWTGSAGAASYNIYRSTVSGGQGDVPLATGVTLTTFKDTGLTNGTIYYYKVAGVNGNGTGAKSNEANAKPAPPAIPAAPTGVTAVPGNNSVTLSWNTVTGAATYNVYRSTTTGTQGDVPIMAGIAGVTFLDTGLTNGQRYFYKVAAVNVTGTSAKSSEVNTTPFAPATVLTDAQKSAFKFLRQATWGPTMPLVDHVVTVGKAAFLDEQFALPATPYPQTLVDMPNMELVSEQFFQNALDGEDQLRQRVAWALSQIWVASAVKVDNTHAMVPFIRILEENAFGNVRDLLEKVTLSPAMGEFLDMVNNKKANTTTGTMPNENYARELMQLFTIGLVQLNPDGSTTGASVYGQSDILEMARVLTGWTYGDAVTGDPSGINPAYYDGPMEPVARYHDLGSKTVLGATFPANQTARADLAQALDLLFNHPNMGPFLSKQLIQRLVKSNPSPQYIADVAAVFANNGQGVRGDLKAVVRAILLHAEAAATPNSGKFSEPALFLTTLARGLNSTVIDHPFMTDFSQDMSQRIWFAPSVFNYFSPGYRLNGVPGPELQIWSTATAMTRTNFVAALVSGGFGTNFTIDTTPYLAVVGNLDALIETANARLMGGTMGPEMKQAILTALASATSNNDRIRTVLYLIGTSMQYQVEH